MRVLFYGTPVFALPTLRALTERHTVVAVVTQPDRPAGRGQHPHASAVRDAAAHYGLPILQPRRLREPGWAERLAAFAPDVAVVAAFGQILPADVLKVPRHGSINVHASLLPRYRGAAPVAWAIIRGERETGVTTFLMDAGMDTGPLLLQRAVAIAADETTGELAGRLADVGAALLLDTLASLPELTPRPQDEASATYAPRLKPDDGLLDWQRPARELVALIRGLNPWPGARTVSLAGRLAIWRARAIAGTGVPGTLVATPGLPGIATGDGLVEPLEVQAESRRVIGWDAYLRGARLQLGTRFGAD
jgi:methionyl-tRNA formyltransferase